MVCCCSRGFRMWLPGLVCVALWPTLVVAQPPVIKGVRPLGLNPGQTARVTITGSELTGLGPLWTSVGGPFPLAGDVENNGQLKDRAVFDCALPADTPLGLHTLRVVGANGVSTQRLWLVDDLPVVAQEEGNTTPAAAQGVAAPCAVDGVLGNLQRRYFRFEAQAGQRVAIEVFARRLGSALDPVIVLYQQGGRQLATSDDVPGLGGDCQLVHRCESDGAYIVEVRDIRYRGGEDYPFWLRIGDFPCVQTTYPLAIQRGAETRVEFAGVDVTDAVAASLAPAEGASAEWLPVVSRRKDGTFAGFASVALSDRPELIEQEPNDTAATATAATIDQHWNGRLQTKGDVDLFRFPVEKGTRLVFQGVTRFEGTPTDLQLRLLDAAGKQLAVADDDGVNEGRLDHTFAEAGDSLLEVRDLLHRGGPEFVYRVEVQRFAPTFRLTVEGDGLNVPVGGTGLLSVQATRLGYNGPIELTVEGLPAGTAATSTTIGAGLTQGYVTLSTAVDGAPIELAAVRIIGTAAINGEAVRVRGETTGWLRGRWNQLAVVPPEARRSILVSGAGPQRLALEIEPAEVVFGPQLSAEVQVRVRRGEGLDAEVALVTIPDKNALPKEIALEIKPIPKGADSVTLKFTATDKAPQGAFSLVLNGTLKQDKTNVTVPSPVINYRLAAPFTLSVEPPAEAVKIGGTQTVTVRVQRNPAFSGAVKIKATGLPAGVTLPEGTIAAEASEVQLQLSAATEAAVGMVKGAKLVATAADNDKLTAETALPELRVE